MIHNESNPPNAHPRSLRERGRRVRTAGGLVLGLSFLIAPGCSDDGIGKRYAVSGLVSYKGQPVNQGTISFDPVDPACRTAAGTITEGRYSLTTMQPDDGAMPGKYRVTIMSKDFESALASDPRARNAEDPQKQAHFANKVAKSLIPAKYQLADTSTLTATVEAHSNTFNFDLTD
jgi:hypothetical protein